MTRRARFGARAECAPTQRVRAAPRAAQASRRSEHHPVFQFVSDAAAAATGAKPN